MNIYINGIGSISAQLFNPRAMHNDFKAYESNKQLAIEPDYKDLMPPMQLRRMSKVVKLGIAAAKTALLDASLEKPDIITTGTAYGCLADTEFFLQKMIKQEETLLTPTSFIQSTHNTVSGQIALMLTCHGHNFTYVQRGHSFESSLQESMMWLAENEDLNILTGGIDELTQDSFDIISRFGTYKKEQEHFDSPSEGTIAGEGANIFILGTKKSEQSYAELVDMKMCKSEQVAMELQNFLSQNELSPGDIDTCLIGTNGDTRYDGIIQNNVIALKNALFIPFKKYCGEYPTSGSFAMALASHILYQQKVPDALTSTETLIEPKNILIYNHYKNQYHSFILLKKI